MSRVKSFVEKAVCITGCSSGFGRVTALHLAQLGWSVFATVRKVKDQEALIAEAIVLKCDRRIVPVICDITQDDDVLALRDVIREKTPRLDALINNAGTAYPAPLELLPAADFLEQLNLNVVRQLSVTQALLPMLKLARGKIVNVSSTNGKIVEPVIGAYCASKFALEAVSDTLRIELAPFGVGVVVIEPDVSHTAIYETATTRGHALMARLGQHSYNPLIEAAEAHAAKQLVTGFPPKLFAETVAKILTTPHPRTRYVVPRSSVLKIVCRKLISDRLYDCIVRKTLKWNVTPQTTKEKI